eukprot:1691671-Prorocentrum_lima.AAC.1
MRISELAQEEKEYAARLAEMTKHLGELSPNMRASEECAALKEKLEEIMERAREVNQECVRVRADFSVVKTERARGVICEPMLQGAHILRRWVGWRLRLLGPRGP